MKTIDQQIKLHVFYIAVACFYDWRLTDMKIFYLSQVREKARQLGIENTHVLSVENIIQLVASQNES